MHIFFYSTMTFSPHAVLATMVIIFIWSIVSPNMRTVGPNMRTVGRARGVRPHAAPDAAGRSHSLLLSFWRRRRDVSEDWHHDKYTSIILK
jgi:hypothetical protein